MARQRYCRRLTRYRNTLRVSADPVGKPAAQTRAESRVLDLRKQLRERDRLSAGGGWIRTSGTADVVETDAAKREFGSGSGLFAPPWGGSGGLGGSLCFPFPTPGNGQQESRLAPIGRHLRLLRRGVLRTGCFPRQAAFQGGHEIDDGWRGRDLPGFNGEPLHLGFD